MSGNGNTISIQVSEQVAGVISTACECLARQMMGQISNSLDPLHAYALPRNDEAIASLRHCLPAVESQWEHGGISPAGVSTRDIAWDVYQTVRQWLAYRRQPEGGFTVDFHDPMQRSGERIGIESVDGDPDPRPMKVRMAAELEELLGTDLVEAVRRVKVWKAAAELAEGNGG